MTNRRTLLVGALGAGTGALIGATITACGATAPPPNPSLRPATSTTIADGLAVRGEQVRDAQPQVQTWLRSAQLL